MAWQGQTENSVICHNSHERRELDNRWENYKWESNLDLRQLKTGETREDLSEKVTSTLRSVGAILMKKKSLGMGVSIPS